MVIYAAVALSIFVGSCFVYLFYSKAKLRLQLAYIEKIATEESNKNNILNAEKIEYIQKIEQLSGQLKYQQHLIEEFNKLKAESHESAKAALFDLGNNLSKQLIEIHKKENQESRELSEQNIKTTTSKFNAEFERIVGMVGALNKEVTQSKDTVDIIKNSLLSPSGAGSLAEITLENILRSSGLRSGVDFVMQYSINSEEEKLALRPDCVLFLPGDRLMVIDAKASKFLVEDQTDLKNLARTMNNHLKSLTSKSYAEAVRKDIGDKGRLPVNIITLMFLPSEHAVEKLMEADNEFMNKAWKADIFPVGPSGLMNMLSFAKFQISEQMMVQNHLQIIEEVKKLMSAIGTMAEHSVKLGNSISNAVTNYDKFAASFNRNFLSKARKLSQMGIEGGLKKDQESLKRLQVFISKAELIEVEPNDATIDNPFKGIEEET
ncbi:MAG: DNA recombination protein RmuC [Rickettsiaceae bacterium]